MSSQEWRCAVAVIVGVILDAVFNWRFLPYSARTHQHEILPNFMLPILALVAGLLLTLNLPENRRLIPLSLIGGFLAAHICLVVADCASDPTNHNLWPFEFVFLAVMTSPAFLGAGIIGLIQRMRKS